MAGRVMVAAALCTLVMAVGPAAAIAQSTGVQPVPGSATLRPPRPSREQVAAWRTAAEQRIDAWTSPRLTTFRDEAEFRRYLADLDTWTQAAQWYFGARRVPVQLAQATSAGQQSDTPPTVCMRPQDCQEEGGQSIVVTGSRIVARAPRSITNTQEAAVDEGDIVKQIGHYLLVLQDGRVFAIDMAGGADRRSLTLTDRANVYRDPEADTWYDEMLVFGDRVVITGYSYRDRRSEISVFRLDQASGRLGEQATFLVTSNDYYSTRNYASRIVDGQLVVYNPLELAAIRNDGSGFDWPSIRRWTPGAAREGTGEGRSLLGPSQLYRPTAFIREPTLHLVSACPLEPVAAGRDLDCRTTGFVGASGHVFYVSPRDAYLWVGGWDRPGVYDPWLRTQEDGAPPCDRPPARLEDVDANTLYRLPIADRPAAVVGMRGGPVDQYGMAASGGRFRALIATMREGCAFNSDIREPGTFPLRYFDIADAAFGDSAQQVPDAAYRRVPSVRGGDVAARFTDTYLVYGGRNPVFTSPLQRYGPDLDPNGQAVAFPIASPGRAQRFDLPHSIMRAERAGDDIAFTGYADRLGLSVSVLDLSGQPEIASTERLPGRYESEGRSHAFNSDIAASGAGLMGLPTIAPPRTSDEDRQPWRTMPSDISFLAIDGDRQLRSIGALRGGGTDPNADRYRDTGDDDDDTAYRCEVSCIDWYGNSRPIFIGGRIFALSGTQLVEGNVRAGRIRETQRLDLTTPPRR